MQRTQHNWAGTPPASGCGRYSARGNVKRPARGELCMHGYKNPTIFPSGPIALARHLSERDLWLLVPS